MTVLLVGLSHKTAPIEIRERLALPERTLKESLLYLNNYPEVKEKVILSTCNRVEVYAEVKELEVGTESIKDFLSSYHKLPREEFERYLYTLYHKEAIAHLFRVSASLDSMVVGEPQILGQVKDAYLWAKEANATGIILNQLFERAFSVAKLIRTETRICENAVSISFAAVELAKKIFGTLKGKTVLLVGAGEMAELAARHLSNQGVETILVANRTFERAEVLAKELGGKAVRFGEIEKELLQADIVISSTAAPHYLVEKKQIAYIIKARKNRPMFFIDIAVPRNIDPAINELDNVYLYDIDDLHTVVEHNLKEREKEALKGEEIVRKETLGFIRWLETLNAVPTIKLLRDRMEKIRIQEMEKTLKRLNHLSERDKEYINALTISIINKILHKPIVNLKKEIESPNGFQLLELTKHLFGLDKEPD
jgi:glutamyl-tRNA reductase